MLLHEEQSGRFLRRPKQDYPAATVAEFCTAVLTRLVGAILMEQSEEWAAQRARYMTLETMAPVSDDPIVMLSAVPGA